MAVPGHESTPYAQLSPPSPTVLFTTYCGWCEGQVQILGALPGMSTRIPTILTRFFAAQKIPWQIKVFAGRDA
jgi:hypothetical protein